MPRIQKLVQEYQKEYQFIAIYIQEAHAEDEWPIYEAERTFRQHRSLEERMEACRLLVEDYRDNLSDVEVFVDRMDNAFESNYASWPFRFWVLELSQVLFKAMPIGARYDLQTLKNFFESRQTKCLGD